LGCLRTCGHALRLHNRRAPVVPPARAFSSLDPSARLAHPRIFGHAAEN